MAEHHSETARPDAIPGAAVPAQRSDAEAGAQAGAHAGAGTGAETGAETKAEVPAEAAAEAEPVPTAEPLAPDDGSVPPHRWSPASRLLLATAAAFLAGITAWHLGTVFLSIAPSNTLSQTYQSTISAHVYPEFEQNWQLFAPNPLQNNIAVQARVQTLAPDGSRPQSGWIDLTAQDIAHIHGNPAPSHIDQNLLRRAWDYYTSWHNQQDESSLGTGGPLSKDYLKRIALQRLGRHWHGSPLIQIQFRSATTPVAGPTWTGAPSKPQTSYRTLQWWAVADEDYAGLAG